MIASWEIVFNFLLSHFTYAFKEIAILSLYVCGQVLRNILYVKCLVLCYVKYVHVSSNVAQLEISGIQFLGKMLQ